MIASAITWNDVIAHESALSSLDPAAQSEILDYVNNVLVVDEFGGDDDPRLRLARIYLAAHHGTLAKQGTNTKGPIVSQTVGPISRSYASSSSMSEYSTTVWGQAFLAIVRVSPARAPLVI